MRFVKALLAVGAVTTPLLMSGGCGDLGVGVGASYQEGAYPAGYYDSGAYPYNDGYVDGGVYGGRDHERHDRGGDHREGFRGNDEGRRGGGEFHEGRSGGDGRHEGR